MALRSFSWKSSQWRHDGEAGAAEIDEGDEGRGPVEAKGAVAEQADLAVQRLDPAVGQAEADRGEDAVAVAAEGPGELDERLEL